jgi:acetyl esterase/lipase
MNINITRLTAAKLPGMAFAPQTPSYADWRNTRAKSKYVISFIVILLALCILAGCATTSKLIQRDTDSVSAEVVENVKPSFLYRFVERYVWNRNDKAFWALKPDEFKTALLKVDQSDRLVFPSDIRRHYNVAKTIIQNRSNYIITPKKHTDTRKAVLFLHGGGNLYEMDSMEWSAVRAILEELSIPVCVPMYPIYPETDPDTVIAFVLQAYQQLMAAYPNAKIIGVGDSSGADILLSLCHYISTIDSSIPFMDKLICVSPAMSIEKDESVLAQMYAIEPDDPVFSVQTLDTLATLFNLNQGYPNWFNAPFFGDFSRFPPIYVFSGTHEIFYPQVRSFVDRVRSQGKKIELYTGYSMMHCWIYLPVSREAKQGLEIYLNIIRET